MKAVFIHNNIYRTDPGGRTYSSEPQFGSEAWRRYLDVFQRLTVVGRLSPFRPGEDPASFALSECEGVSFRFLPNLSGPIRVLTRRSRARRELMAILSDADAVIVRGMGEPVQLAARMARRLRKPVAAEVVGCAWDALWNYGNWQGKVLAPITFLRARRMVASAHFAIYVSQSFLQRRYPNNGHTAVASNVEIEEPNRVVLARRLGRIATRPSPVVIGMIGSLKHRYKGVHVALRALAVARDQLPSFEFRVLGLGDPAPWRSMAEDLGVGGVTRFCGTVPSGEPVLDWLDDIDLYIQPSFQEGVPRAMIEAMSRGCPALGSSAGGIGELLDADFLHRPGDARRLAAHIVHILGDRERQVTAARRNFEVAGRYSTVVLSARRQAFWKAFAAYAASRRGNG